MFPTVDGPVMAALIAGLCLAVLAAIGIGAYAFHLHRRLTTHLHDEYGRLRDRLGADLFKEAYDKARAEFTATADSKSAARRRSFKDADPATKKRFMRGVLGVALTFATIIVTALAMSFHYQVEALEKDLGAWAYPVPIITDLFLIALIVADLLFLYAGHSYRVMRILPLGPAAFTIALNMAAHEEGESLAGHLAPPLVVIAVSEFLRFVIIKWADLTADHRDVYEPIPLIHWILRFGPTWKLWRRRVTSYTKIYTLEQLAEFEAVHTLALAQAKKKYGTRTTKTWWGTRKVPWRKEAPDYVVLAVEHNLLQPGDVKELARLASVELFGTAVAAARSAVAELETPAAPAPAPAPALAPEPVQQPAAVQPAPAPEPAPAPAPAPEPPPVARRPASTLAAQLLREGPVTVRTAARPAQSQGTDKLTEEQKAAYTEYEKRLLEGGSEMQGKELGEMLGVTASQGNRVRQKFAPLFVQRNPAAAPPPSYRAAVEKGKVPPIVASGNAGLEIEADAKPVLV